MSTVKQVIVIRKDLKMTKGKMIAQGSHASLGVVLGMMERRENVNDNGNGNGYTLSINVGENAPLLKWLEYNIFRQKKENAL